MESSVEIGPGTPNELFRTLNRWELFPSEYPHGTSESFYDWPEDKVAEFIEDCKMSTPYVWTRIGSPYGFISNTQLRGGPYPCSHLKCRTKRVRQLAIFASLYADQVLIPDPFWFFQNRRDDLVSRIFLVGDLLMLKELRPLLEAGIIRIAPAVFPVCQAAKEMFDRESDRLARDLEEAGSLMSDEYVSRCSFQSELGSSGACISVNGPEQLVEHGETIAANLPPVLRSKIEDDPSYTPTESEQRFIARELFVDPVLDDLMLQNWITRFYDVRYLSDRTLDEILVGLIDDRSLRIHTAQLAEGITHTVPVLHNADIEELLEIRMEEGEAFSVYRNSLETLVRRARESEPTAEAIREEFNENVKPEIDRLEAVVRAKKEEAKADIRERLVLGGGLVSVAVFSGLLPPDVSQVISWLGGSKYGMDVLERLNELYREPAAVRQSEYYFVWRLQDELGR